MTTNDEDAELAQFNDSQRRTPVHAHMGLKCLEHGPRTVVTMELSDSVRGPVPGSVHGGMLATLADAASAFAISGEYELEAEIPVTTDMHIRYHPQLARPRRAWPSLAMSGSGVSILDHALDQRFSCRRVDGGIVPLEAREDLISRKSSD
jgi:acyl-coenzyme A thioesterase PaaI-like protein